MKTTSALDSREPTWANTTATTADGKLTVTGRVDSVLYTHGGRPVQVIQASFDVENRGATARSLAVRKIELLWNEAKAQECPAVLLQPLTPRGLGRIDGPAAAVVPSTTLSVRAGSTACVAVYFDPISVSHDFGKREAIRVQLDVDGELLSAISELSVARVEPEGGHADR